MKHIKKIFALALALLFSLSLTACLVPKDGKTADATAKPADPPSDSTGAFDGDAIAIELGDVKITANEFANAFDNYINIFAYTSEPTAEMIDQCYQMTEEELIRYYLPLWKAKELGVALSEEEEAALPQRAEQEVEDERNALLCQFAYYYGATDDILSDMSELTEDQLAVALSGIEEQLADMFGEGFTFDDYLALEKETFVEGYRIEAMTSLLKEKTMKDAVGDDKIEAWYAEKLESQKAKYASSPLEFITDSANAAADPEHGVILYAPAGFARVQVIELQPDADPDPAIAEKTAEMTALEAEYGLLKLNEGDEARAAEIEVKYAALKAEKAELENVYYAGVTEKIDEAYAALESGTSFEDAMKTYNRTSESDERIVWLEGADSKNGDLADVVKSLTPGTYSKPTVLDGSYVIVKYVETIPEGPVDRAAIAEQLRAVAAEELQEDEWNALFDEWLVEAKLVAVYHRETYDMLGDMYME